MPASSFKQALGPCAPSGPSHPTLERRAMFPYAEKFHYMQKVKAGKVNNAGKPWKSEIVRSCSWPWAAGRRKGEILRLGIKNRISEVLRGTVSSHPVLGLRLSRHWFTHAGDCRLIFPPRNNTECIGAGWHTAFTAPPSR